jgi:hypothetical protein
MPNPAPGCVAEGEPLDAVRAQTPNLRAPVPGSAARRIEFQVARVEGTLVGTIRIVELDGTTSVREVVARDCAELGSALALVVALIVDAGPASPSVAVEL